MRYEAILKDEIATSRQLVVVSTRNDRMIGIQKCNKKGRFETALHNEELYKIQQYGIYKTTFRLRDYLVATNRGFVRGFYSSSRYVPDSLLFWLALFWQLLLERWLKSQGWQVCGILFQVDFSDW